MKQSGKDKPVLFPNLRKEVKLTLANLCDVDYAKRVWANGEIDEQVGHPVSLDEDILTLDDRNFESRSSVGVVVCSEEERTAMVDLLKLFERYPPDPGWQTMIGTAKWQDVMTAARRALELMDENDSQTNG